MKNRETQEGLEKGHIKSFENVHNLWKTQKFFNITYQLFKKLFTLRKKTTKRKNNDVS